MDGGQHSLWQMPACGSPYSEVSGIRITSLIVTRISPFRVPEQMSPVKIGTFFLNLASFRSSDEFLETVLRNRAWDQIGYVSDPSFQWNWKSEDDFERFRSLRSDAESVGRRSSVLIAALVVNRLVSGLLSSRNAGRMSRLRVALGPPEIESNIPSAALALTF